MSSWTLGDAAMGGKRSWSDQKKRNMLELPLGQASKEELDSWPLQLAKDLLGEGNPEAHSNRSILHRWLEEGIDIYTDFSGVSGDIEAITKAVDGIIEYTGWRLPPDCIRFKRSCDKGDLQISIHQELAENYLCPPCHFGDITSRSSPVVAHLLLSLPIIYDDHIL